MILAFDIGNTNISVYIAPNNIKFSIETDRVCTADSYFVQIFTILQYHAIAIDDISQITIASVVPSLNRVFEELCTRYFKYSPKFLTYKDIPIKINMPNPAEVGIDRLVNAHSAILKNKANYIIIDIGTAVTFDIVLKEGIYEGGMIFPGPVMSLKALRLGTAKLPEIMLDRPKSIIGKTTVDAIKAGIFHGYIGMIDGIIAQVKSCYECNFDVILTGGFADVFSFEYESDPELTLRGIVDLARHQ